jgi:hypothetical protein
MTGPAALLRRLYRVTELLSITDQKPLARDEYLSAMTTEMMVYLSLEEQIVIPELERRLPQYLPELRRTHVKARLSLFRIATSPPASARLEHDVRDLRALFRSHALHVAAIVRALGTSATEGDLRRLGDDIHAFLVQATLKLNDLDTYAA